METKNKTAKGFTLIEVLVAAALMVMLSAGFLGLQYLFTKNQSSAWQNYLNIEDGNNAITTMIREIRDARQSETGSYVLDTADDQELIFYSDVDHDGTVERVRYTLSGTDLIKGVTKPTGNPLVYDLNTEVASPISSNVRNDTNPVFYYYNSDWPNDTVNNPLVAADRIADTRTIEVSLSINTKANDSDNDFLMDSVADIRMLKAE